MKAYLVIVFSREYYGYERYNLKELFRQVVFSEEQLKVMQDNFDEVQYTELYVEEEK